MEKHRDLCLTLWSNMVRVSDCTQESMEHVKEAAKRTGDIARLSPVD